MCARGQFPACPNTAVCSCSDHIIECHERGLTSVPFFQPVNHVYTKLNLENNFIKTIPADAFKNIPNQSTVFLNNNSIRFIDEHALGGVDGKITRVNLAFNNFTRFPSSLGVLSTILNIDVSNNPIDEDGFDEHTVYEIGDTTRYTLVRMFFGNDS
ncbi:hypothetical protein DPMN_059621 [Dreissena polymorpha]|uniref:LRRNT domain-containing protein n=1 Tax=Dreissena polymorpha TaxID=45954 RepID=A0A9D4C3T7_DREPO|nr:hypothetical protein DPMN_059621 [Dreissena polymorpha]